MMGSKVARRPLWLIVKYERGCMDVLTINYGCGGETLPVFSFEEEAEAFLRLGLLEASWRARETMAGELVSVLYGPCAGVEKVALDPLPVMVAERMADLISLSRERFVRDLVGEPSASRRCLLRLEESVEENSLEA